jgi:hypothetical protein
MIHLTILSSYTGSIKWFIEDQAFSPSYDLAPISPFPVSKLSVLSLFLSLPVSPVEFTDGRGGGGGAESYDGEKAWFSINQ